MKKTFTLSISGRIFQVEEDAYALLLDYLESLSQVFKGEDGREIVDDIENRISEIFQEEADKGKKVFSLADAEAVIVTIGNAAQLAADSDDENPSESPNGKSAKTAPEAAHSCPPPMPPSAPTETRRKLFRSETDKVLGGVLGGLAARFGVSVVPLRIITVLLLFVPHLGFGPLFIAYCIAWGIIPPANTPERKLEQQGLPVTVTNIGEMLSSNNTQVQSQNNGFHALLRVAGTLCMGFLGLMAGMVGVGMLIAFVLLLSILVATLCGLANPAEFIVLEKLPLEATSFSIFFAFCCCVAILVPCIALVWAACNVLFKVKGANNTVWITALVVEVTVIIGLSIMALFI